MWVGWLELDLLLGDIHSLKEKRSVVRPIVAEMQRRYAVSVAEVGGQDLYRRTTIGASLVAGDREHVVELLDAVERQFAGRPEVDLLSARRGIQTSDD